MNVSVMCGGGSRVVRESLDGLPIDPLRDRQPHPVQIVSSQFLHHFLIETVAHRWVLDFLDVVDPGKVIAVVRLLALGKIATKERREMASVNGPVVRSASLPVSRFPIVVSRRLPVTAGRMHL